MNTYHCSISAIKVPPGSNRRKGFAFKTRIIAMVPWNSMEELQRLHGPFLGDWVPSTNQRGTVKGLPHISGACVARKKGLILLYRDDGTFMEINSSNFIGAYEEDEN